MHAALPYFGAAQAERGAIAGQSAERRRHTDRSSGIRANRRQRRTLLHAGSTPTGRAAGQLEWIAGLEAVAVVAVLTGDAVCQLVQVGLADNYRAGSAKLCGHFRVAACNAVLFRIEAGAGAGGKTRDVKAVLDRDRNTEEEGPLLRQREVGSDGLRLCQCAFLVHG